VRGGENGLIRISSVNRALHISPSELRSGCSMVAFFYWGALYVYPPILAVYAQSMGASFAMVGMVVGAYSLVQMLLRILVGIWSGRLGKRSSLSMPVIFSTWLAVWDLRWPPQRHISSCSAVFSVLVLRHGLSSPCSMPAILPLMKPLRQWVLSLLSMGVN